MNDTEGLVYSAQDVDLFNEFPKLEGKSNWEVWKYQFYAALNTVHPMYAKVVFQNKQPPDPPAYLSIRPKDVIRAAIQDKLGVGQTFEEYGHAFTVTKQTLKEKEAEIKEKNKALLEDFEKKKDGWMNVNHRAWIFLHVCIQRGPRTFIKGISDPRDAFLTLEAQFAPPHWVSTVRSFNKLSEICYDGRNPMDFVRNFQEKLQYLTEFTGSIPSGLELCLFIKSISANSRYESSDWDPETADLESLCLDFIQFETTKRE
jgi:hypothetical protein